MEGKDTTVLTSVFAKLEAGELGNAIHIVRSFVDGHPYIMYDDELDVVERDYGLMLGYMRQGFNDPQREEIYRSLIRRLYHFSSNLLVAYKIHAVPFFSESARKSGNRSFSHDRIKTVLENFVADVAMLSLEPEGARAAKGKEVYRLHNDFMQELFCSIVVSRQWSDDDATFFENLLLSPTTDTIDAQLVVSAITLAVINVYDPNKFGTLIQVYAKSEDEKVRQRALVGWVFASASSTNIYPEQKEKVVEVLKDDAVRNEIAELQRQVVFCMNAEQDTDKIRRDIMPDLMKNNNISITRFGITEKEDDPMEDVFDPGASERKMEKVEESFRKMTDMQKAGSDIYFGGFSQMKRFSFFQDTANWFCPFYAEHPGISSVSDKMNGTMVMQNIISNGPFCDSDKYSFVLALSSVISSLPANIKEMFNSQEAFGMVAGTEGQGTPAYIRRTILQDMYRFYRLFPQRSQLVNPFSTERYVFVTNKLFDDTGIEGTYPELCHFMIKQRNRDGLGRIMEKYRDMKDPKCLFMHGVYELDFQKDPYSAARYLERLEDAPQAGKRTLSLLARAYFEAEDYESAAETYARIYESDASDRTNALNYCVALSKAKKYDDAINILYKLNLEDPDSMNVVRVLAWTLMGLGKLEPAWREYRRLTEGDDTETGDWLNAGYCQWFMGNVSNAVTLFKRFNKERGKEIQDGIFGEMAKDTVFLKEHGIGNIEMMMMCDLVDKQNE